MELPPKHKENIGKAISVSVSPKISHSIALAGLAKHYFGGGIFPMSIGGVLGYLLGSNVNVSQEQKNNTIRDIIESQNQLRQNIYEGETDNNGNNSVNGIMSSSDLLNYKYSSYPFSGKWNDFIGKPSINFHAMIYGRPKQGKSILAVQFAQYLSENFGKVLYIASEEGFSVTLQKKIAEFAMDNANLDFANYRDFTQIRNALQKNRYNFVFIDSVNFIKITPEDVEDLKAENKQTAFITIQQATKNGNFRGSQEFAHNCDIVVRVEAGIASQQGRFQEPTEMNVFDKPEVNANAGTTSPNLGDSVQEKTEIPEFSANDFSAESEF